MYHYVPNLDDGEPSSLPKPNKTDGQDDIVELCWDNGQVVFQNQSTQKKTTFDMAERETHSNVSEGEQPPPPPPLPLLPLLPPLPQQPPHLFIQEDEMSSWLQYPMDDSAFGPNLCDDLLYHTPPPLITTVPQPQIRLPTPPESLQRLQNFVNLSRFPIRQTAPPAGEATVVDSSETPMVVLESRFSHMMWDTGTQMITESGSATPGGTSAAAVELAAGTEVTTMSSPGGSRNSLSTSGETHPQRPPLSSPEEDRKRKAIIVDDHESEDIEFEAPGGKKLTRGSTSATKRTRAAEVHNQSERRRRDRINEKMRLLQELIPRCNKSDKASMLDEAIEYLKSLQMQVQMMSMGCGMVPMMYSNMQQYMPSMGMGIGMGGMNINMADMGMNRPAMVPYPGLMPNPAAAHMTGARYPMPPYPMHPVPAAAPAPAPTTTRIPPANPTDPAPNFAVSQNQTQPGMLNFVAPYQQYPALHLSQLPLPPQNQAAMPSGANKKKENGSSGTKQHNGDKKSNEKRDGGVPPPD